MKRTRKWAFVEQEAVRLASLGLAPKEIAAKLSVRKSTVTRWMASGKIPSTRVKRVAEYKRTPKPPKTPAQWAAEVRRTYALDATDDQLVTMAQIAAETVLDPSVPRPLKLQAAGRYQSIVKQLSLVTRSAETEKPATTEPVAATPRPVRQLNRPVVDPRKILMAVK